MIFLQKVSFVIRPVKGDLIFLPQLRIFYFLYDSLNINAFT
jgi:hypothetical protein